MTIGKKEMGALIKQARAKKSEQIGRKYTQQMLADDINKSQGYIGDLESGRTYPSYAILCKIAEVCNLPVAFFGNNKTGQWVKQYREQNDIDLEELSEKSGSPIEELRLIENGGFEGRKSLQYWMNIGKALGLTDEETMTFIFWDTMYSAMFKNDGTDSNLNLIRKALMDSEKDRDFLRDADVIPFNPETIIMLPVYGRIAAGIPITANQENGEYYPMDTRFININGYSREDFFFLRVKGNSMEPGIMDGDLVLVRRQPRVETNEVAVVLCDNEDATVKRVTVAGNKMILNSDNRSYPPQIYNASDCCVIGKVLQRIGRVK